MDDCSRLREIVDDLRAQPKKRFVPALLSVAWSDVEHPDVSPDFTNMVRFFATGHWLSIYILLVPG